MGVLEDKHFYKEGASFREHGLRRCAAFSQAHPTETLTLLSSRIPRHRSFLRTQDREIFASLNARLGGASACSVLLPELPCADRSRSRRRSDQVKPAALARPSAGLRVQHYVPYPLALCALTGGAALQICRLSLSSHGREHHHDPYFTPSEHSSRFRSCPVPPTARSCPRVVSCASPVLRVPVCQWHPRQRVLGHRRRRRGCLRRTCCRTCVLASCSTAPRRSCSPSTASSSW